MTLCWMYLLAVAVVFCKDVVGKSSIDNNCQFVELDSKNEIAYLGWPHYLNCRLAFNESSYLDYYYDYYSTYPDESELRIKCEITTSNHTTIFAGETDLEHLLDEDYSFGEYLPDLQKEGINEFMILLNITEKNECFTTHIALNVLPFAPSTCSEFQSQQTLSGKQSAESGGARTLQCEVLEELYPKLHTNNITYQWWWNCQDDLPSDVEVRQDGSLRIPRLDFNHAGLYTCSVTYKNMSRFISFYEFCLFQPLSVSSPTMTCSVTEVHKNIGDEATFACVGNFGEGHITQQHFNILWRKQTSNEDLLCGISPTAQSSGKINCSYEIEEICFLHVPTEAELESDHAIVNVQLKIRNIQLSDYGSYIITVVSAIGNKSTSQIITLSPNRVPDLLTQAQVAGICVGAISMLLITLGVAVYYRIYIRVYYKRYFGKYGTSKDYAAVMYYNYDSRLDTFMQKQIKTCVDVIHDIIRKRLRYELCDEKRDMKAGENRTDVIRSNIANSHRIIILLTTNFQRDEENTQQFQQGFLENKYIFIVFPGVMEYMKQKQATDNSWRAIYRAVQTNYAIKWNARTSTNKSYFRMQLEDALPKLHPVDTTFHGIKYNNHV